MPNNYFRFKKFVVYQDKAAMKVGTDSVILGTWADFSNANKILDVGSGTGILSLIAAQKTNANITAVEIDYNAFMQSSENFERSQWHKRLKAIHMSFIDYINNTNEKYDYIICNPPFFHKSLKSPNSARTYARHTELLNFADLFEAETILNNKISVISLIIPEEQQNNIIATANKSGFYLKRKLIIKPNEKKHAKRIAMEFSKEKLEIKTEFLTIEKQKRHDFTDDYISLTKEFYTIL